VAHEAHGLATVAILFMACQPAPTYSINGLPVALHPPLAVATTPEFKKALEHTIATGLDFWGGNWADLIGWELVLRLNADELVHCGWFDCSLYGRHRVGFVDPVTSTISIALPDPSCPQRSSLVHELGHVVIGDQDHSDLRWGDTLYALEGHLLHECLFP
jgi:hypothetical protein